MRKNSSSMSFKGYRLPYIKPQLVSLSKDKRAEILKEQQEQSLNAEAGAEPNQLKEVNRHESGSSASGSDSKRQSQNVNMQIQNEEKKKKDHPENSPYHNVANGGLGAENQNRQLYQYAGRHRDGSNQ